jgi:predicted RND superfamily exporter protein
LMPRLKPLKAGVRVARSPLNRLVTQLTIGILRRPRTVLLASLVVTVAALWTGSKVRVDSALLDQFRPDDPIYQTTRLLETQFEGVRPFEVMLSSDQPKRFLQPEVLKAVARVSAWASKQPGVLTVMDATDPLSRAWAGLTGGAASAEDALRTEGQLEGLRYVLNKQKPSPIAGFLSDDAQHTRIRIRLTDLGSRATLAFTDALKAELSRELGHFKDIKVAFTGDAYVSSRGLDAVVSDLTGSLGLAVATILAIIVLVFRSVRYGLLSIPPNVVPLAFALAWMVLRDIPLNAATAIIFSVSIGVAVDGSIHVLSRLREELRRYPGLNGAVLRTARGTGRALVVSCSSLVLGFSVLLLSSFVPVQRFAELIAVSIASCLVATLVILPAVVQLAGPRFLRE